MNSLTSQLPQRRAAISPTRNNAKPQKCDEPGCPYLIPADVVALSPKVRFCPKHGLLRRLIK